MPTAVPWRRGRIRDPYGTEQVITTTRPDWDSYFMGIARISSKRATCLRGKTGAVLVREPEEREE